MQCSSSRVPSYGVGYQGLKGKVFALLWGKGWPGAAGVRDGLGNELQRKTSPKLVHCLLRYCHSGFRFLNNQSRDGHVNIIGELSQFHSVKFHHTASGKGLI